MKNEKPLTTGDIARFCSVTVATVCNWVKAGKLDVFMTPGGQYRMEKSKFISFLKENGFPISKDLIQDTCKVLTIDPSHEVTTTISRALADGNREFEIQEATGTYDALLKIGRNSPNYVVFSGAQPNGELSSVVRFLKENPDTRYIKLVVINIAPGVQPIENVDYSLVSPVDSSQLAQVFLKNSA